jgi:UDP-N-acetylmuramoyl-tripeptide--D-alanyl-D-alanine ligase
VQRLDNRRFVRRAQRRLADVAPLVVGITGSYGKTTTKACVAAVLDVLGPAYPTPASFNSYLGVVRAINEGLKGEHKSFVVEMGAYREGDVAELCELTRPSIAVLTAVGPAHLERFGSIEAIERAKGEIAASLPPDGTFVTRGDDERLRRVAAERARCPTIFIGLAGGPGIDVWPENVRTTTGRTTFDLCIGDGDEVLRAAVRTRLLGGHNVANLLAAAAVGHATGLEIAQIAAALSRVRPPAHRLEPITNTASGVVVIDDSYNSNPAGAASAIDVLAQHPAERRILVTPGMVELGEMEEAENRRLGERAAAVCDRVIVIGSTRGARAVEEGLRAGGLDGDRIVVAPDGAAAHTIIATETRRGDVILFENDVPDVYVTPPR